MWVIFIRNDMRVNGANCGSNDETDYGSFNYFLFYEEKSRSNHKVWSRKESHYTPYTVI